MPQPVRSLVLGTAGHIDHGKTALVGALTGVDTDRLAEEKRRGITIELGFARYEPEAGCAFGVVDVPGHEGFVKTMVAGATGMDVVLLVVAADEGVMPQTREHVAIVGLLGIAEMVVALTKADLAEDEWLDLVQEDVEDLLADTPYRGAEVVPTSAETGAGLDDLALALTRSGARARRRASGDLFRLPVDRVFAVEGAGTVVTGTLWSGSLARGESVRLLPHDEGARVRAVQVHGEQVESAVAGQRTAVALTGAAVRRGKVARGDVLVSHPCWAPAMMLTVEIAVLTGTGWRMEAGQRVRVHLATVEVLARVALFGAPEIAPGDKALAQLRLEMPAVARCGDRFVVRSYSPVATIAGGVVLEPVPPKRKRLSQDERAALSALARGGSDAVRGAVALAGWAGLAEDALGVQAGRLATTAAAADRSPAPSASAASDPAATPSSAPSASAAPARRALGVRGVSSLDGIVFGDEIVAQGEDRILAVVKAHHRRSTLDVGAPLEVLRGALPSRSNPRLAAALVARLVDAGRLVVEGKAARLPEFEAALSPEEEALAARIAHLLDKAGLQGPTTEELSALVSDHPRTAPVLGFMASRGRVRLLGDAYWTASTALAQAAARTVAELGGQRGLGPADFRKALPVTRKHLIPLLAHLDATGVTIREPAGRRVSASLPPSPSNEPGPSNVQ